MVLCLLALPIFLVLGIFSLKYRKLAKDALDCLLKTVTLRKCESGLDDRIRSQITGKVLKFSPKAAGFVYRHYRLLSWIFIGLLAWSAYQSAIGIHNYYLYGNCNGPESTGFCLLDPTGENTATSEAEVDIQKEIVLPKLEEDDPIRGSEDAELTIIEFGCYACPYTKKAESTIMEVLDYYHGRVNLQFKTFVIPRHNMSYDASLAANCALEQAKYGLYHKYLLERQENLSKSILRDAASEIGLDVGQFDKCIASERYKNEINEDTMMGIHAGVAGTPTFFVNGKKIVGPKPFKTFKTVIDGELKRS